MSQEFYDEKEMRKALAQIMQKNKQGEQKPFEVRIIGKTRKPISGYFASADALIEALKTVSLKGVNVYATLQILNSDCMSMPQANHFVQGATATADKNVMGYAWLFIDIDPVRSFAEISSSDAELKEACDIAKQVVAYMSGLGFNQPVKALSGNGAHLLYKINLANNDENIQLVKDCLNALSLRFDTDTCKIDTANFNPSRVCKLYGTLAQKGTSTKERPHRMSHIIGDLNEIQNNPRGTLQILQAQLPAPDTTDRPVNRYNNYNAQQFSLEDFLDRHAIIYRKATWNGEEKFVLEHCPFDASHNKKDAAIIRYRDGALAFKCFHNSCQDKHWRDVRKLFEPNAYERKQQEVNDKYSQGWKKRNAAVPDVPIETPADTKPFLTMLDIINSGEPDPDYIRTGFTGIDTACHGLVRGGVSVVSGLRGSGKSTWLNQLVLNAINQDYRTIVYSGELSSRMMGKWLLRQAAGRNHVIKPNPKVEDWDTDPAVVYDIGQWMQDKFWLYNNQLGCNFDSILQFIQTKVNDTKADLILLDNLMALDIRPENVQFMDIYEAQKRFIQMLKSFAVKNNVHVLYVAHPRKALGFLRLNDVSGSGDLTNMVDLALVVHRNNKDYQSEVTRYYRPDEAFIERHEEGQGKEKQVSWDALCDNVIEIAKERETGNADILIPFWFDKRAKRFLNHENEYIKYGWQDTYKEPAMEDDEKGW